MKKFIISILKQLLALFAVVWIIINCVLIFAASSYPISTIVMTSVSVIATCIANAYFDHKDKHWL